MAKQVDILNPNTGLGAFLIGTAAGFVATVVFVAWQNVIARREAARAASR